VKFPITQKTYPYKDGFEFINRDKVLTTQNVSLVATIDATKADDLVKKYRGSIVRGGGEDGYVLDEIIYGPVTREIGQQFVFIGNQYTSDQLYADGGRALLAQVHGAIKGKYAREGIIIEQIMPVGPPQLPKDIVSSIQGAMRARTDAVRKDAELAATIADGKKLVAKEAAASEARALAAESIRANPEVLKLEEIRERGRSLCPVNVQTCILGTAVIPNSN
jgi:hypothetical protein